jgi:hypothetical protein
LENIKVYPLNIQLALQVGRLWVDPNIYLPPTAPGSTLDAAVPHFPLITAHPLRQVPIDPLISLVKSIIEGNRSFGSAKGTAKGRANW